MGITIFLVAQILGEDWPWSTVESIIESCSHSLQLLTVGATCRVEGELSAEMFFRNLPELQCISLGPELFDLFCRSLNPASVISVSLTIISIDFCLKYFFLLLKFGYVFKHENLYFLASNHLIMNDSW